MSFSLLLGTYTPKKIQDLKRIVAPYEGVRAYGGPEVCNAFSPIEIHRSSISHAKEKALHVTMQLIKEYRENKLAYNLVEGFNRDKIVGLGEDSGLKIVEATTEMDGSIHPLLDISGIEDLLVPSNFPGPHTKEIIERLGIEVFFDRLYKFQDSLKTPFLTINSFAKLAAIKIDITDLEVTPGNYLEEELVKKIEVIETTAPCYLLPRDKVKYNHEMDGYIGLYARKNKNISVLDEADYANKQSPRAIAVKAIIEGLGVKKLPYRQRSHKPQKFKVIFPEGVDELEKNSFLAEIRSKKDIMINSDPINKIHPSSYESSLLEYDGVIFYTKNSETATPNSTAALLQQLTRLILMKEKDQRNFGHLLVSCFGKSHTLENVMKIFKDNIANGLSNIKIPSSNDKGGYQISFDSSFHIATDWDKSDILGDIDRLKRIAQTSYKFFHSANIQQSEIPMVSRLKNEKIICVFGHHDTANVNLLQAGAAVGEVLAKLGYSVIYGGGSRGVVGEMLKNYLSTSINSKQGIHGAMPPFLSGAENIKGSLPEELTTIYNPPSFGHRFTFFGQADMFLFMPGGLGTLGEYGEFFNKGKRCIVLNLSLDKGGPGVFDSLLEYTTEDHAKTYKTPEITIVKSLIELSSTLKTREIFY